MTMYPNDKSNMIALGCLSPKGLYNFLNKCKDVDTVSLVLDNDEPADREYKKISELLVERGYIIEENSISEELKECGLKDVNEYLVNVYNPMMKMINSRR
ncbi:MAG: toprim domain-containing protein [Lachnospiraceae bacterium]|nr:toprim domain-containing protein [Lachnospiraceae bacterium]